MRTVIIGSPRVAMACVVSLVLLLVGCSSSGSNPSSTTVDLVIQGMQDKIDELESKINATTLPPPTTQVPTPTQAPYIARTERYPTGSHRYMLGTSGKESEYDCRSVDYYSDGSSVEGPRNTVIVEKWYYGACG